MSKPAKVTSLVGRRASREGAPADPPLTVDEALSLHLDALYATGRALSGSHEVAEDLVQETAVAAFRAWPKLRDLRAVKAWLLRILYHAHLHHRRRERRRPAIVDVDLDELLDHSAIGDEGAVAPESRGLSGDVQAALASLPEAFCEAVWLIDVQGLTLAEASGVLDVPLGTVASRVHRARRLLRERLAGRRQGGAI